MADISGGSLEETYLQISPNILKSFPKFRPPVDLWVFDHELAQTRRYHKGGDRLSTDGQGEVARFAEENELFLLRDDYKIYAKHLSKRLGLMLVEEGFCPLEVAEIFFLAFRDRMDAFLSQPNETTYEALLKDVTILAEYLWIDPARVDFLSQTLDREYGLSVHSTNTMFIGLSLYLRITGGTVEKDVLVSLALGLILHDLGMAKVPRFVTDKKQYLVRRDRESIENHIDAGLSTLKRLKVTDPVILECVSQHHERLDGSGYPTRRFADTISLVGKICSVADSFSALIGERPYHSSKEISEAALALAGDTARYDGALTRVLLSIVTGDKPDAGCGK